MANENAAAKNGTSENALSWLYDITIGSIREFINMQSLKAVVRNKYEAAKEKGFEGLPISYSNGATAETQAKMWAFQQILLNGKENEAVQPEDYAKLFFGTYESWSKDRPESKKLQSNDVQLMETAIGMLLKEKEFSGLAFGAKLKAITFWDNVKDYRFVFSRAEKADKNSTKSFGKCAIQLFNMCYGDKAKMQLFHDVMEVWTSGRWQSGNPEADENKKTDIEARAAVIVKAINSGNSKSRKSNVNPLLLESNVSTSIALAFEQKLDSLNYGRHKQDALRNAVKYFGNDREKCNDFEKLYNDLGKCPNEKIGEQLQKILVSKVVSGKRRQSLDGLKKFNELMQNQNYSGLFGPYTKTLLWYMDAEKLTKDIGQSDIKKLYVLNSPSMVEHAFEMTDVVARSEELLKKAEQIGDSESKEGNSESKESIKKQITTARKNFLFPQCDLGREIPVMTRPAHYTLRADGGNAVGANVTAGSVRTSENVKYRAYSDTTGEVYRGTNENGEFTDSFTRAEITHIFRRDGVGLITSKDFARLDGSLHAGLSIVSVPAGGHQCRILPPYSSKTSDGKWNKTGQIRVSADDKNEGFCSFADFEDKFKITRELKGLMQRQQQPLTGHSECVNTLNDLDNTIEEKLQDQQNQQNRQQGQQRPQGQQGSKQKPSQYGNSAFASQGSPCGYDSYNGGYDDDFDEYFNNLTPPPRENDTYQAKNNRFRQRKAGQSDGKGGGGQPSRGSKSGGNSGNNSKSSGKNTNNSKPSNQSRSNQPGKRR